METYNHLNFIIEKTGNAHWTIFTSNLLTPTNLTVTFEDGSQMLENTHARLRDAKNHIEHCNNKTETNTLKYGLEFKGDFEKSTLYKPKQQ